MRYRLNFKPLISGLNFDLIDLEENGSIFCWARSELVIVAKHLEGCTEYTDDIKLLHCKRSSESEIIENGLCADNHSQLYSVNAWMVQMMKLRPMEYVQI